MAPRRLFRFDEAVKSMLFITGTDTGAGKTVLTALLAQFLRERGDRVAAFKPICSGGRGDARQLRAALAGALTLDEINPWNFRAPVAPLLAARREKQRVTLAAVRSHLCAAQKKFAVTLVEGAGGLRSPLGENFDSLALLAALPATPIIVAPNKIGTINHLLLTLAALPEPLRDRAQVVLMTPAKPDAATGSNAALLAEFFPRKKIFPFPWLGAAFTPARVLRRARVRRVLAALAP